MTAALKVLLGAHPRAFDPMSLPNLAMWLDASDASSITASSGLVSQWSDKSGAGRHVTASGAARPTTGANTQNGLNVITFDRVDDVLVSSVSIEDNSQTWYVACKRTGNHSACPVFLGPRTSSGITMGPYTDTGTSSLKAHFAGTDVATGGNGAAHASAVLLWGLKLASTVQNRVKVNGTLYNNTGSATAVTPASTDRVTVGSLSRTNNPFYWGGHIFEFAVYTDTHDQATMDQVIAYFSAKWGET